MSIASGATTQAQLETLMPTAAHFLYIPAFCSSVS
jgi:hypothetical protein